jgi:integrase
MASIHVGFLAEADDELFFEPPPADRSRMVYDIRARNSDTLPGVFSQEEVGGLFKFVTNLENRSIPLTVNSTGLRVNEVLNHRKADILIDSGQLFILSAKGKRDRYSLLSEKIQAFEVRISAGAKTIILVYLRVGIMVNIRCEASSRSSGVQCSSLK